MADAAREALPPLPDIRDIIRDLANDPGRVEDICFRLFSAGYVDQQKRFRIGSLAGDEGQSLSVMLTADPKTGKFGNWKDFATGEGGDIFDLCCQVLYGGDKKATFWWALDFLKLRKMSPEQFRQHNWDQERAKKEREKEARKLEGQKKDIAWRIWHGEAQAEIMDTPVEFYLRDRPIDIAAAPSTGALRYHPDLPLPYNRGRAPAMVGIVQSPHGKFLGVHRTYLICRADGTWDRYREELDGIDGKFFLGAVGGGYVSISKGPSGKTLANAPDGDKGIMIEGIEDALIMAIARRDFRVLACLSLGNLAAVRLPATVKERVLFLDNDTHPDALKGAEKAKAAQLAFAEQDGALLKVSRTPGGKDPNELIRTMTR